MTAKQLEVLAPGAKWPEEWRLNYGSGFRERFSVSFGNVIANARMQWIGENTSPPTIIRVAEEYRAEVIHAISSIATGGENIFGPIFFFGIPLEWHPRGSGIYLA